MARSSPAVPHAEKLSVTERANPAVLVVCGVFCTPSHPDQHRERTSSALHRTGRLDKMNILSTIGRRRRRPLALGAAVTALLSLSSVLSFGGTASAVDFEFQYWGNDSSCYAEAFCVNTNTVDACSTTCYMWFAPSAPHQSRGGNERFLHPGHLQQWRTRTEP